MANVSSKFKKLIKSYLVLLAIVLANYLVFSFIFWNFDPIAWGETGRIVMVFITLFCSFLGIYEHSNS